jgi:hypothetical protein
MNGGLWSEGRGKRTRKVRSDTACAGTVLGSGGVVDPPHDRKEYPMKKQNGKKLALLTQTVRNLDPSDLGRIVGGKTTAITCTCPLTTRCTGTITD